MINKISINIQTNIIMILFYRKKYINTDFINTKTVFKNKTYGEIKGKMT